jgi:peptide chain release factor 1
MLRKRADRYAELTRSTEDPAVYNNPQKFKEVQRERGSLKEQAEVYAKLARLESQIKGDEEILTDKSADSEMRAMAEEELKDLKPQFARLTEEAEDMLVLEDASDSRNCILEIRGAEGGDEATLFARELMETYARFCTQHKFKLQVMDEVESEVGGLKSGVYAITGENVWKWLKYEAGGHRVQRVPATETQGRIHTSLATVAVLPEVEEVDIKINEADLEIKAARSGGPGGQNVNKTSSRCQMRHIPTGIFVDCQATPSFHKNKDEALRILRAKLYEREQERIASERKEARSVIGSGKRGEKIRTYNFPQSRCTDHRCNENFGIEQVMAGRLDDVILALRKWERSERLKELARQA